MGPCRAFLTTGALIWLSGCAVGPDYEPPVIAVPEVFGTALLTPAVASASFSPSTATADFVRWWQGLHDPRLNALIERAVASNPDIEIMLTRVQEARSREIVVLGAMLPTVGGRAAIATGTGVNAASCALASSLRTEVGTRGRCCISHDCFGSKSVAA